MDLNGCYKHDQPTNITGQPPDPATPQPPQGCSSSAASGPTGDFAAARPAGEGS